MRFGDTSPLPVQNPTGPPCSYFFSAFLAFLSAFFSFIVFSAGFLSVFLLSIPLLMPVLLSGVLAKPNKVSSVTYPQGQANEYPRYF
jgi:hypothetical protein